MQSVVFLPQYFLLCAGHSSVKSQMHEWQRRYMTGTTSQLYTTPFNTLHTSKLGAGVFSGGSVKLVGGASVNTQPPKLWPIDTPTDQSCDRRRDKNTEVKIQYYKMLHVFENCCI